LPSKEISSNQRNFYLNEYLVEEFLSEWISCRRCTKQVDRDGSLDEIYIAPFVGQIFLNEEEAFAFCKRYVY